MAENGVDVAALEAEVAKSQAAVTTQGDTVRALKAKKADKEEVAAAIEQLRVMKLGLEEITKRLDAARPSGAAKAASREALRQQVANALERRLFYIPAFKIYGSVAGLYDYGPPGCAVKSNVLALWRQHYVLEENMLEVECPCVTPEVVLKASGHVDKFTDLMVKDVVNHNCFRADHLLKDVVEKLLAEPGLSAEKKDEYGLDLARVDEFTAEELGTRLKKYGVKAPDTKNDLTEPFPFNLMFATSIGPTGQFRGFMRPETAQGIFVNFRDLLYYNGGKLPFAAAQIGQAYRNEISPRQGLLRVREFTLAEIEHFVNPDNKDHPKFDTVAPLSFLLYPRAEQLGPKRPVVMNLGEAVGKGVIANQTLGYFIGRTYLFLTKIGIDSKRLRFRQHLQHEMAHYAEDCWDAEIECTYGWVECVGLADRSAYDLKAHTDMSGTALVAFEKYSTPKEVEVLSILPDKKELGKIFKKDAKVLAESLEAMSEEEALGLKSKLEETGSSDYTVCTTGQSFTLQKDMVRIEKKKETQQGRTFTPSVIEPSFGIGRIIYCLYEHSFYTREGDEQRTVFRLQPVVAPIKCTIFPLVQEPRFDAYSRRVEAALTAAGLSSKSDSTGTTIGKRYARTDEIGVPFAVTIDFQSLEDDTVTVRERDSTSQIRVPVKDVAALIRQMSDATITWEDVQQRYPAVQQKEDAA
eukprot:jgi/Chlat1/6573/Chrsp45S05938